MGIIKRQSLKTSLVNYLGVLLGVVFFNFIFPHLIHEEYLGLIGLFQYLSLVLAAIPGLGLAYGLLRYYSSWKEEETLHRYHRFSVLSISAALLVFSLLLYVFRAPLLEQYQHRSPLFVPFWYLIIPLTAIFAYNQYLELFSTKNKVAVRRVALS